jgi:hypothetical protein
MGISVADLLVTEGETEIKNFNFFFFFFFFFFFVFFYLGGLESLACFNSELIRKL